MSGNYNGSVKNRNKARQRKLLIGNTLFRTHLPGCDGEREEIAVFFQGVRQREPVIDNDILLREHCFSEMESVIPRINTDLIAMSGNFY